MASLFASGIEKKVKDATGDRSWGPSGTEMKEIAESTFDYESFKKIMPILWKRLNESSKHWKRVYKTLLLLDYLIRSGSQRVVEECRDNIYQIKSLQNFRFTDELQRDQGINVRTKSKAIVELLSDDQTLREERENARRNADKYVGISSESKMVGFGSKSFGNSREMSNREREWAREEKYGSSSTSKYGGNASQSPMSSPVGQRERKSKVDTFPRDSPAEVKYSDDEETYNDEEDEDDDDFNPAGDAPASKPKSVTPANLRNIKISSAPKAKAAPSPDGNGGGFDPFVEFAAADKQASTAAVVAPVQAPLFDLADPFATQPMQMPSGVADDWSAFPGGGAPAPADPFAGFDAFVQAAPPPPAQASAVAPPAAQLQPRLKGAHVVEERHAEAEKVKGKSAEERLTDLSSLGAPLQPLSPGGSRKSAQATLPMGPNYGNLSPLGTNGGNMNMMSMQPQPGASAQPSMIPMPMGAGGMYGGLGGGYGNGMMRPGPPAMGANMGGMQMNMGGMGMNPGMMAAGNMGGMMGMGGMPPQGAMMSGLAPSMPGLPQPQQLQRNPSAPGQGQGQWGNNPNNAAGFF